MASHRDVFGPLGVWISKSTPLPLVTELAVAAERSGFGSLWVSGGSDAGTFDYARAVLEATQRIVVGTSVANMWVESAADATGTFHSFERQFAGRFYFGAGPSHAPLINGRGIGEYLKPLAKSREYFDQLDAQGDPIPTERRLLGALGPLALRLAKTRSLGSVPYLVPAAHTAFAREELGPDAALAPELGVALDDDLGRARATARAFLKPYLAFPNYTDTFLKFGFAADDLADGGSDALLDGIFALGTVDAINRRIDEHLDSGADHVALQLRPREGQGLVEMLEAVAESRGMGG
jgi:probable F420-dependent oxidoreductase